MNYKRIYDSLILQGSLRLYESGLHQHRIVPGYEGGEYVKKNITFLTAKEHTLVHKLRYKLFGRHEDACAHNILKRHFPLGRSVQGYKRPKFSEEHKQNISKNHHDVRKDKNPMFRKKHAAASIEKMRIAKLGNKNARGTKRTTEQTVKATKTIIERYGSCSAITQKGWVTRYKNMEEKQ